MTKQRQMRYSRAQEVRRELAAWMEEADIPDREWDYLVRKFYVDEVLKGERAMRSLHKELLEIRATSGTAQQEKKPRARHTAVATPVDTLTDTLRTRALAELVAAEATASPIVRRWRQNVLPASFPLSPEDADMWLTMNVYGGTTGGGVNAYIEIPISLADLTRASEGAVTLTLRLEARDAQRAQFRYLRIRMADGSVQDIPAYQHSELESLRKLADTLSARYPWTIEDAAWWVLTGITPPVLPTITAVHANAELPALGRLVLQVDPEAMPAEVASTYARLRQAYSQEWSGKTAQIHARPPHPWRLEMVTQVAPRLARLGDTNATWQMLWHEWNDAHPDHRYETPGRLRSDYGRARRQLLWITQDDRARNRTTGE